MNASRNCIRMPACWLALLVAGASSPAMAGDQAASRPQAKASAADQKIINDAMRAAPKKVAQGASIVAMEPDGSMRALREGNNGFTCMPDNPSTPGPDPMCMDKAALEWVMAWVQKKQPTRGKTGFIYMLAGGTDASNTDPYATKPQPNNNWIETGPHVMVVGAEDSFYDMYPKHAKPDTAVPYIMWPGTPYQHVMIPVK